MRVRYCNTIQSWVPILLLNSMLKISEFNRKESVAFCPVPILPDSSSSTLRDTGEGE